MVGGKFNTYNNLHGWQHSRGLLFIFIFFITPNDPIKHQPIHHKNIRYYFAGKFDNLTLQMEECHGFYFMRDQKLKSKT